MVHGVSKSLLNFGIAARAIAVPHTSEHVSELTDTGETHVTPEQLLETFDGQAFEIVEHVDAHETMVDEFTKSMQPRFAQIIGETPAWN